MAFRGIFTIPPTPFRESGEIDPEDFRRIIDFCIESGAHGIVYPANASEFTTLSDAERMQLCEILMDQVGGRIPVIINVSGVSKEVATAFARHAKWTEASGVIALPPYVRKRELGATVIRDYYRAIADVAERPVFIQNDMPPVGTPMSPDYLLRLCREIEWVQYVKEETAPSTANLTAILDSNDGSCKGCFGGYSARYLIEEYRRGSSGNMPGGHVTDVVVSLWNALESGNHPLAMRIIGALAPLLFFSDQDPGYYKEVLRRRGVIQHAAKRNGEVTLDPIASAYLDEILDHLSLYMTTQK